MRILFLTNNISSEDLIKWLKDEAKEEVVLYSDAISEEIIDYYKPDFLISYNYRYIIKQEILGILKDKALNLHISLLPWNRGADPNIWSFLENTPKGVSIHIIDKGIDTGAILLQKELYFCEEKDTLSSSYKTLNRELQKLFVSNWNAIKNSEISSRPQSAGGSVHYKRDFEAIKRILGLNGWDIKVSELKGRYEMLKNENH